MINFISNNYFSLSKIIFFNLITLKSIHILDIIELFQFSHKYPLMILKDFVYKCRLLLYTLY